MVKIVLIILVVDHKKVECPQGDLYALKCINKNSVVQAGQRRHVKAEREILMEVDSKFILKLYKTFRDVKYVYLLTEVLMGGELFTLMKRNGPLEEGSAKFAMGCILEAIEYLHGKNVSNLLAIKYPKKHPKTKQKFEPKPNPTQNSKFGQA